MAIPAGRHNDWPWPFSLIPRKATAVESDTPPTAVAHSKDLDKVDDIPNAGNWVLLKSKYGLSFAVTGPGGWHFRIGTFRYDYVDKYYTFPTFTVKRLK